MLNPNIVRQAVANLLVQYPELFDDDEARELAVQTETDAVDYLRGLEQRRREAETMAGALAAQIAQFELRQARFVAQEKACRAIALKIMDEAQLPKIVMPEATYSVTKGRDRVVIDDPASVPADYCHPPVLKPDLKRIAEALKEGAQFNWAAMAQGDRSLSVRTK